MAQTGAKRRARTPFWGRSGGYWNPDVEAGERANIVLLFGAGDERWQNLSTGRVEDWCHIWHHGDVVSVQKIEQKARRSPKSLSFAEACDLAEAYFGPPRRGSGSHVAIYKMPWQGDPRINLQAGEGGKAKEYQVKQLIKAIDRKKGA